MVAKAEVMKALKKVIDPETGIDVVTMKMIKKVEIKGSEVKIEFTPTSPFCPMVGYLAENIKKAAETVKGIKKAGVEVTTCKMK